MLIRKLRALAVCRNRFADLDVGGHWTLSQPQPYIDKRGCVTIKALDASEELIDILPDMERLFE